MIDFKDTCSFELAIMDCMGKYKEKLKTAEDIEMFSDELHQHIEIAIEDMLEDGNFNWINPEDYNEQY